MPDDLRINSEAIVDVAKARDRVPRLSVVIPAYNEGPALSAIVDAVLELAREQHWEVLVVDDGSVDNTCQLLQDRIDDHYLKLVRHPYNRGYGAAIKTGIRHASARVIATMDADGQHDPMDLLKLSPLAEKFDLVVGKRPGGINSRLWRMPGKWLLGWFANYLTRRKIPDLNSGMRMFHRETITKYLHIFPEGFSFSTTSTLAFFNRGYAVTYVPISIAPRHPDLKSTVKLRTGFETLILVLRLSTLFEPLRVFIPISIFFAALGFLWGLPYIYLQRGVSVGSLLLILTGLLIFFFGLLTDQVSQLRLEKYE